jgi:hypothetical protein
VALLKNSDRHLYKATYAPLTLAEPEPARPHGALLEGSLRRAHDKAALLRGLQLQSGEVARLRRQERGEVAEIPESVWEAAHGFEPQPVGALVPSPAVLADHESGHLVALARAVLADRTDRLRASVDAPDEVEVREEELEAGEGTPRPGLLVDVRSREESLVAFAAGAIDTFTDAVKIAPIGLLHLERIEMAPTGIERGELLATIPLGPGEKTSVVQKEWSATNEEFSTIVTDSLESYSEKGAAEKSDLAEASESQSKHSQQLGLEASVSGSYGVVSFSASSKFDLSSSVEESQKVSRAHSEEITSKASSRVRKERKVTIQTSSVSGSEEVTTRTLENPSKNAPLRVDYYSLMRKWRVRLIQYGLRLTYDIAIPEPGATLRGLFAEIEDLDTQLTQPFEFALRPDEITRENYQQKAADFGASVPAPPMDVIRQRLGGEAGGLGELGEDESFHYGQIDVPIPDGYRVNRVALDAILGNVDSDPPRHFVVFGAGEPPGLGEHRVNFYWDLTSMPDFLKDRTGRQQIVYQLQNIDTAAVTFSLDFVPTEEAMAVWRFAVWQALHDVQRDAYYAHQQALAQQRQALVDQLSAVDTLTLRREEREEITKGVLRWLLGPAFDFMPASVVALFAADPHGRYGMSFTANKLGIDTKGWATMFRYQEMVKFIQEAIEWENLLYFLYPYFWDVPAAWDFVRDLEHPDPTRQSFVRAGSARVVLTIRPGYEEAFAAFIDLGDFGKILPPDHPYLTIGEEMRAYAQTNYPGIPPANPEEEPRPLLSPAQRRAWKDIQRIIGLLEEFKAKHGRYPTTAEGLDALKNWGEVPAADPWGHPYVYRSPGRYTDYELSSLGADGEVGGEGEDADVTSWAPATLVAEWNEYTPSHGVDIGVNGLPDTMA